MARLNCTKDIYEKRCIYPPGYHSTGIIKIMVGVPCCCSSDAFLKWYSNRYGINLLGKLKNYYGIDYLQGSATVLCDAIVAGWDIKNLVLWMGHEIKGYTYNDVKYMIHQVYNCWARKVIEEQSAGQEIDVDLIFQPLRGVMFEEPFHYDGLFNGCDFSKMERDKFCKCIRDSLELIKTWTPTSEEGRDNYTPMTAERIMYYLKYINTIILQDPRKPGVLFEVHSVPTNIYISDYSDKGKTLGIIYGRDAFVLAKALNDCADVVLIDNVADDGYHYASGKTGNASFKYAHTTGISTQAYVDITGDYDDVSNGLHEAIDAGMEQVNLFAEDIVYCKSKEWPPRNPCEYYLNNNIPEKDRISLQCLDYISNLDRIFGILDAMGIVERNYICWNDLVAVKICDKEDCSKCTERDWRTVLIPKQTTPGHIYLVVNSSDSTK